MPPPAPRAGAAAPAAAQEKPKPKFGRWEDEPESGGWDNADTVTSFPEPSELPEPTPRVLPPIEAARAPASPEPALPAMRGPYPTAPGVGPHPQAVAAPAPAPAVAASPKAATASHAMAATAGLGSAMREEVWAIVRAAVEEAVGPIVARQRELEARLERAEREPEASRARAAQAAPAAAATSAASRLASIGSASATAPAPTPLGPALLPAAFKPADLGNASLELPPAAVGPSRSSGASAHPVGPRPSVGPQGYGVSVTASPRPSLDLDAVGPVDVYGFDGGRRKRNVARVVVVLMLLLIGGAVTMMVLSYN